jgi:predicted Zn-dependent protease
LCTEYQQPAQKGINMLFGRHTSTADWTNYFLNMDFTRSQEAQADEDGLKRLQKAHVDNQGFKHFFERMEKSDSAPLFISDHPSNQSRLEMTEKFDNQNVTPIMTKHEWEILKNYCSNK